MVSAVYIFCISLLVVTFATTAIVADGPSCKEPAGRPDMFQWGMCSCFSGYAPSTEDGTDCNSHARCAGQLSDPMTFGANQPARPVTVFKNDQLIIVQQSPIVSNRLNSTIKFAEPILKGAAGNHANTPGAEGATTCNYPGTLWVKTINQLDCQDVFTASIPWAQSSFCGFVEDTNSTNVQVKIIKSTLVHQFDEMYMSNAGKKAIRSRSTSYLISVSFATQQTVSTQTLNVIIADATLKGFVKVSIFGNSVYDVSTGMTTAEFRTVSAWPYELDESAAVLSNVVPPIYGLGPVTIENVVDESLQCDSTQDSDCAQHWRITITADATTCNIGGLYNFTDNMKCRDISAGSCPNGILPVNFALRVGKTDLCAVGPVDTSAMNTFMLTPFFSATDSEPTLTYQTGDMIYWTLEVVDPLASLDRVEFNHIALSSPANQSDVLINGGTATALSSFVEFAFVESLSTVRPGEPARLAFQYRLLRSQLVNSVGALAASSGNFVVELTTSVTVDLYYHGNQKRTVDAVERFSSSSATQSRSIILNVVEEEEQKVSKEASQPDSIFDELTNSANTLQSLFGLFVAVFAAFALKF